MDNGIILLVMIALSLFIIQGLGGWLQICDYRKAVHRVHKLGNVGIGQTRSGIFHNNLVLIACDGSGKVTGMEVLNGMFIFSKFHPEKTIAGVPVLGQDICELLDWFTTWDKKQGKQRRGYIQAVEALHLRLYPVDDGNEIPPAEAIAAPVPYSE